MERRVVFSGWVFPALLLMPHLAVTIVFFFWPAGQAILQSVQRGDAFGLSTRFVGLDNFAAVLADPSYLVSVEITFLFSLAVAIPALAPGLLLAAMTDKVMRGATLYKAVRLCCCSPMRLPRPSPACSGCFCSPRAWALSP